MEKRERGRAGRGAAVMGLVDEEGLREALGEGA